MRSRSRRKHLDEEDDVERLVGARRLYMVNALDLDVVSGEPAIDMNERDGQRGGIVA